MKGIFGAVIAIFIGIAILPEKADQMVDGVPEEKEPSRLKLKNPEIKKPVVKQTFSSDPEYQEAWEKHKDWKLGAPLDMQPPGFNKPLREYITDPEPDK